MRTLSEARRLADLWVEITCGGKAAVADVVAKPYGWVFSYQSHEFIRTGEEEYFLVGTAPFVIDRINFEVTVLGTAKPLEDYLREFEKSVPAAVMKMRPEEPWSI